MKIKLQHTFVLPVFIALSVNAQSRKELKADKSFDDYSYVEAAERYKYVVKKSSKKESKYAKLGDSYYNMGDYDQARHWYAKMMETADAASAVNYVYKYAQTLKVTGEYQKSDEIMQKLGKVAPKDKRYVAFSENPNYLEQIKANSDRYELKNVAINSKFSDFAALQNDSTLLFSSARDTGRLKKRVHLWNNDSFHKLYRAKVGEGDSLSKPENIKNDFAENLTVTTTTFSPDGKMVYFTRNNITDGKFNRDDENANRLKIYRAEIIDGKWSNITDLPFNSDSYSTAHPSLNEDGTKLYFVSDMPGSFGESDIYVANVKEDGSFGAPENLGSTINTESRESFPYVGPDNILYFASDGHPGLGGLDVFATKLNSRGKFNIQNLGKPVNSVEDDFSYTIKDTDKGYFASKREGGLGSDDIYAITELKKLAFPIPFTLKGLVVDSTTQEPINMAKIAVLDNDGERLIELASGTDGTFEVTQDFEPGNYNIAVSSEGFEDKAKAFEVTDDIDSVNVRVALDKTMVNIVEVGTDLKEHLNLDFQNIYFEFNKYDILEESKPELNKIVKFLQDNPTVKIDIRSHTDARGSAQYNQKLSERRAQSTLSYLVENGIDADRLTAIGLGESQLINDCVYGTQCSEEEHQRNRRSEFIIIEN